MTKVWICRLASSAESLDGDAGDGILVARLQAIEQLCVAKGHGGAKVIGERHVDGIESSPATTILC